MTIRLVITLSLASPSPIAPSAWWQFFLLTPALILRLFCDAVHAPFGFTAPLPLTSR